MSIQKLLSQINSSDNSVLSFSDFIIIIDENYDFEMTAFNNGPLSNKAGENNGSCKVFSFAKLHQLSDSATLKCFGEHYQKVLDTPDDDDHMNIRQFMKTGLEGISFEKEALSIKL